MNKSKKHVSLFDNISKLKGIGSKTYQLLKRKKIQTVADLLWNFPRGYTDRSNLVNLDSLEIGKITTIKVKVIKYNFPRIRNLPNKVNCEDEKGKIDFVFFNSREGYIRKVLPINSWVVASGKVGFFKKKYQITNPSYIVPLHKEKYVKKVIPKYSLTDGLNEKPYRKIIENVLSQLPNLDEWHSTESLKKIGNKSWKESILSLHKAKNIDIKSTYYKRLAYDEILSNIIVLSNERQKIKKIKKTIKKYSHTLSNKIINNFNFKLTNNQSLIINQIDEDLKSENKMFRLLQGDVGSGKTIVALVAAANVIESKFQVALMAPTEILAKQHFTLAQKIFNNTNVNIELLTGKNKISEKKIIKNRLIDGQTNLLIGTHALFQQDIIFKKLGFIIIDEQHKFGVRQRIELAEKGGDDCDILLMSATPIPRTLILTQYGDMDVSRLIEKPSDRKKIITLSKPEEKIDEILHFIKKEINSGNQVFWVCPLIEESKKLDFAAAVKKFNFLSKEFNNKVGLIHGSLSNDQKNSVLKKFLDQNLSILVSTTVIEVGIDFPNANIIVVENSNKFGLSQLHQLRGRVGRGNGQGYCILLYKKSLSDNARKRIKILKSTNDGFLISEEDMKLRGFGDILGYQQSGIKNFRIADPIQHEDLFKIAEKDIKNIEKKNIFNKFNLLLKLFNKSDVFSKNKII